jgi:hypothetical protein
MGVVAFLVRRSLLSVGVSAAALYRSIEKWNPTFVVDEADAPSSTTRICGKSSIADGPEGKG